MNRNTRRKSVKSRQMPRGLTMMQRQQWMRNATRSARFNAHRRGVPFVQANVVLPIVQLKKVNSNLKRLLSAYEEEQDAGRHSAVIDTISMIIAEISNDILRIKDSLPFLYLTNYPELASDNEDHVFERIEELTKYIRLAVIRRGDNELAKRLLRIIRKAFISHRAPIANANANNSSSNSNSNNSNNSNSNSSNSSNAGEAVRDELDALMGALSGMRF